MSRGVAVNWKRFQFIVLYSLFWATSIWGALQVARLNLGPLHFLCGPWGCLGSTAALISVHLLWLGVLAPLALLLVWALPTLRHPVIWWAVLFGSLLVLSLKLGWEGWQYVSIEQGRSGDLIRRLAYGLAVNTDLPGWQIVVAAAINLVGIRFWWSRNPGTQRS